MCIMGNDNAPPTCISSWKLPMMKNMNSTNVTGFMKTVPIGTRNEIQFIADY